MNHLISIIIPTYNRSHLIGRTLDSVLTQSYPNWECIVVDDGSNDHTTELIELYREKDSRISYYIRPSTYKKGVSSCRNYGFMMSRGEYVNWFDSDDLMEKNLLQKKLDFFLKNPELDYCLSQMQSFKEINGKFVIGKITRVGFENLYDDYVSGKFSAGTPSILWKKKILLDEKLFDEDLTHSEDLEFYRRIFFQNKNIGIIEKPLIFFRYHQNSLSGEFLSLKKEHINSFLEVRKRIITFSPGNMKINNSLIRQVLGVFRSSLTAQEYEACEKCLVFIKKFNGNKTLQFHFGFIRIKVLYKIFKLTGRGDTRFRSLMKIKMEH